MEQSNKRIAKNTIFLYSRLIFVLLVSLYTVRVVLNALGIKDYGVYNVVGGFVSMFGFLNTSMANATQRFYNYEIGKNGSEAANIVYNTAIRTQILLAIFVIVICEVVGIWYLNSKMAIPYDRLRAANWLLQFSLLSLALTILQVPFSAAIMAYEKMQYYAIVGVADVILKFLIALVIKYFGGDRLMLYGLLLSFISLTNYFLYYIYVSRNFQWLKSKLRYYSSTFQKEMLSFSGWNFLGSLAWMLRSQGLNVLLNYYFGVVINAANGIAGQISSALQQFSVNLILAFKPQLVHSYAIGSLKRTTELFFSMSKVSYALLYTLSVPLVLNINLVLHLWLGNEVPDYTSPFVVLTIIGLLINCFHTPVVQMVHATGNMRKFQIVSSIVISSIIPLSWLFFKLGFSPIYGYIVCTIVYCFNLIISLLILKSIFPYSYIDYIKSVPMRCLGYSIIVPIFPILIKQVISNDIIYLLASVMITTAISLITFILLVLTKIERMSLLRMVMLKINHKS